MIIHIMGGGPKEQLPNLTHYMNDSDCLWIGVDRGTKYLLEDGIIPDIAVGDFDSITESEFEKIKEIGSNIKRYQSEKDETDMELAIQIAYNYEPSMIRIFGATGGRLDHFIANINLLYQFLNTNESVHIEIIDNQNIAMMKNPGVYKLSKLEDKQYVSFIPVSKMVENITLLGFKYPLNNRNISFGSTLCISNELLNESGTYSFTNGILLIIRSKDN